MEFLNFLLFNHKITPLTSTAKFRAPHAPVGELEKHGCASSAGRLDAARCVVRLRCHPALPFIASGQSPSNGRAASALSCGDMGFRPPCAAAACSFIALAAWVRELPFWLLNSRVVTECWQRMHLNVLKPFIILIV